MYAKAYLHYLRKSATGIPAAPFDPDLWHGVGDALREIAGTLIGLIACLLMVVTYPVSVFVISAIACERDRRGAKKRKAWLREMSRRDCIDWTE